MILLYQTYIFFPNYTNMIIYVCADKYKKPGPTFAGPGNQNIRRVTEEIIMKR